MEAKNAGDKFFVLLKQLQRDDAGMFGQSMLLWFYPSTFYTRLLDDHVEPELTPSNDLLAYTHYMMSMSVELGWDGQGRVVVPETMLKTAGIGKEVTLIGAMDHFELWNRGPWEKRKQWLITEGPRIERWAQDNLRPSSPAKVQATPAQRDTTNQ